MHVYSCLYDTYTNPFTFTLHINNDASIFDNQNREKDLFLLLIFQWFNYRTTGGVELPGADMYNVTRKIEKIWSYGSTLYTIIYFKGIIMISLPTNDAFNQHVEHKEYKVYVPVYVPFKRQSKYP